MDVRPRELRYTSLMAGVPKQETTNDTARRGLVRALAELSEEERRQVVADAHREAQRQATVSWSSLRAAGGAVSFGGNALADCDALYDG